MEDKYVDKLSIVRLVKSRLIIRLVVPMGIAESRWGNLTTKGDGRIILKQIY
jgi:hypothetical protein